MGQRAKCIRGIRPTELISSLPACINSRSDNLSAGTDVHPYSRLPLSSASRSPKSNAPNPFPAVILGPSRNPSILHDRCDLMHMLDPLIPQLIDTYFACIHPLCRSIDRSTMYQRLAHRAHFSDRQFASLILASAALTALVPGMYPEDMRSNAEANADLWMREAIQLHSTATLNLDPNGRAASLTLDSLATSVLIGSYLRAKGCCDAAHLRTKETLGLLELFDRQDRSGYQGMNKAEKEIAIAMSWTVRVAERYVAIHNTLPS